MSFTNAKFVLPDFWASALINGDTSGLEKDELDVLIAFMADNQEAQTFDVDVTGESEFCNTHDASRYGAQAGNCLTFTFTTRL